MRRVYKFIDGEMVLVGTDTAAEAVDFPYIIQDSMPAAMHADGTIVDSKSQARRITRRNGWEEVGSERLSERGHRPPPDPFDTAKMRDTFERVQAIANDPSKLRAWRYQMAEHQDRLTRATGFDGTEER